MQLRLLGHRCRYLVSDGISYFASGGLAAKIWSADIRGRQNRLQRYLDSLRSLRFAEVLQHQCPRPDLRDGISDAFSRDVRGRAVHRLKHRRELPLGIQICGRGKTDRANGRRCKIGQNVPKQVRRHHHIKPIWISDKMRTQNVDVVLIRSNVGESLGREREIAHPRMAWCE